jgi:hypothetical protein
MEYIALNKPDATRDQYSSKYEMPSKFFPPISNLTISPCQFMNSMQNTINDYM